MDGKQRRVRWKVGDIVSIPIGDNRVAFAWVLREPRLAFFDYDCDLEVVPAVGEIVLRPVAFQIWVMSGAVTSGLWSRVGHVTPGDDVLESPWFFKQDQISGKLSMTKTGAEEVPVDAAVCKFLERASVWEPHHVVDRLQDHFAGRPNKWVELSRRLR
jgi:hypothetical protein